jgi:hypothetical protein
VTEQNDNPERYDGDRCMQVIESWPLKQANGNTMGGGNVHQLHCAVSMAVRAQGGATGATG